jgi:hypothetical protein
MSNGIRISVFSVAIILAAATFGKGGLPPRVTINPTELPIVARVVVTNSVATQDTCTCSCGIACDDSCRVDYVAGSCTLPLAIACVNGCCRDAPNPTAEECPQ